MKQESRELVDDEIILLDVLGSLHAKTIVQDCFTFETGVVFKKQDLKCDKEMLKTIKGLLENISETPNHLKIWIEHRLSVIGDFLEVV